MHIIFLIIISVNKWEEVNLIRNVMLFYDWRKVSIVKLYLIVSSEAIFVHAILKLITMKDKAGWKINLTHKESLKNLNKLPFKKPDIKNWYMAV